MKREMKTLITKVPAAYAAANWVRSIFRRRVTARRLKQRFAAGESSRIIVGSSGVTAEGWIGTDVEYLNLVKDSDWSSFFETNSLEAILAEHVWEHLAPEQAHIAANNCFRYLRSGGYVRAAVPDGMHPDPDYISRVCVNGGGDGADDHKVLYTYKTFGSVFEAAGFQVQFLEHFDEDHTFREQPWETHAGMIHRSRRFDERNANRPLSYTSIILDARKP